MTTTSPSPLADAPERLPSHLLSPAEVRELSRLDPAVSVRHIVGEWAMILVSASLAWRFCHPVICVLAMAFIGTRQHSLLVLMHDGAHHRLLPNRRWNDWLGEVITWPFLIIRMRGYRRNHIAHHRHLNTEGDPDWMRKRTPDWAFPMGGFALLGHLALDLVGVGFVKLARKTKQADGLFVGGGNGEVDERAMIVTRAVFLAAALGVVVAKGLVVPVLLFWVVPFITWMQLANHVRTIAEHLAIEGREGMYAKTRTTLATWFERAFIAPNNINYHVEHHLYPSVPFHRLPELHRRLMALPDYRRSVHVTHGYWSVLRECVRVKNVEPVGGEAGVCSSPCPRPTWEFATSATRAAASRSATKAARS